MLLEGAPQRQYMAGKLKGSRNRKFNGISALFFNKTFIPTAVAEAKPVKPGKRAGPSSFMPLSERLGLVVGGEVL